MLIVYYCNALNQCICNLILRVPPHPTSNDWIFEIGTSPVCTSVCVYLSRPAIEKHYCPILIKLGAHNFSKNLRWHFFQILGNIALLTSWWPFCLFLNAALSWPQFCYYLFQTNKVESCLSRFGIKIKIKLLITLGRKCRPHSQKIACLFFKPGSEVQGYGYGAAKALQLRFVDVVMIVMIQK